MENKKQKYGPQSPAGLQWPQGAKNTRMKHSVLDSGMLFSDTTQQDMELDTDNEDSTPIPQKNKQFKQIPQKRNQFKESNNIFKVDNTRLVKQTDHFLIKKLSSKPLVYQKLMSNPLIVTFLDSGNRNPFLSAFQSKLVIKKITDFIMKATKVRPKFESFFYEYGSFFVTCFDERTLIWLKAKKSFFGNLWLRANIQIANKYDFEVLKEGSLLIPNVSRRLGSCVKHLLKSQNPCLANTPLTLHKINPYAPRSDLCCTFSVASFILDYLKKLNMKPYFGLSRFKVMICEELPDKSHVSPEMPSKFKARKLRDMHLSETPQPSKVMTENSEAPKSSSAATEIENTPKSQSGTIKVSQQSQSLEPQIIQPQALLLPPQLAEISQLFQYLQSINVLTPEAAQYYHSLLYYQPPNVSNLTHNYMQQNENVPHGTYQHYQTYPNYPFNNQSYQQNFVQPIQNPYNQNMMQNYCAFPQSTSFPLQNSTEWPQPPLPKIAEKKQTFSEAKIPPTQSIIPKNLFQSSYSKPPSINESKASKSTTITPVASAIKGTTSVFSSSNDQKRSDSPKETKASDSFAHKPPKPPIISILKESKPPTSTGSVVNKPLNEISPSPSSTQSSVAEKLVTSKNFKCTLISEIARNVNLLDYVESSQPAEKSKKYSSSKKSIKKSSKRSKKKCTRKSMRSRELEAIHMSHSSSSYSHLTLSLSMEENKSLENLCSPISSDEDTREEQEEEEEDPFNPF